MTREGIDELSLYAVCLNTAEVARPDDFWIEFYWAENGDHAEEQAEDANPECAIVCVAVAPQSWVRGVTMTEAESTGGEAAGRERS